MTNRPDGYPVQSMDFLPPPSAIFLCILGLENSDKLRTNPEAWRLYSTRIVYKTAFMSREGLEMLCDTAAITTFYRVGYGTGDTTAAEYMITALQGFSPHDMRYDISA